MQVLAALLAITIWCCLFPAQSQIVGTRFRWQLILQSSPVFTATDHVLILRGGQKQLVEIGLLSIDTSGNGVPCASCAMELAGQGARPVLQWESDSIETEYQSWTVRIPRNDSINGIHHNLQLPGFNVDRGVWLFEISVPSATDEFSRATLRIGSFNPFFTNHINHQSISVLDHRVEVLVNTWHLESPFDIIQTMDPSWSVDFSKLSPHDSLSIDSFMPTKDRTILHSIDHYHSQHLLVFKDGLPPNQQLPSTIHSMTPVGPSRILLHADDGVFVGDFSISTKKFLWKKVLSLNADHQEAIRIWKRQQAIPFGYRNSAPIFVMVNATKQLFYITAKSKDGLVPMIDTSGHGIVQKVNLLETVLDISSSSLNVSQFLLLVKTTDQIPYQMIEFDSLSKKWKTDLFGFPVSVPRNDGRPMEILQDVQNDASFALKLTNARYIDAYSSSVIAWGNALLYSPNGGILWYSLQTFSDAVIQRVATSQDEKLTFLLDTNELWISDLNSGFVLKTKHRLTVAPDVAFWLTFDTGVSLSFDTFSYNGTSKSFVRNIQNVECTRLFRDMAYFNGARCPYHRHLIQMNGNEQLLDRSTAPVVQNQLPSQIYLDKNDQFEFDVFFQMRAGLSALDKLNVSFYTSSNAFIQIDHQTTPMLSQDSVQYHVVISDNPDSNGEQSSPGTNLKMTEFQMNFSPSQLDCRDFLANPMTDVPFTSKSILVYTGCPPHQHLEFKFDEQQLNSCGNGIPCFDYDTAVALNFEIVNNVTQTTRPYAGGYRLRVIGGGLERSSVSRFSDSEISLYNPTAQSTYGFIWSPTSDQRVTLANGEYQLGGSADESIGWTCTRGSPCNDVLPRLPDAPAPEYYLLMEMTTLEAGSLDTRCNFTIQFLVRIYGLPVSSRVSLMTFFLTLGLGAILFGFVIYQEYKENRDIYGYFGKEVMPNRGLLSGGGGGILKKTSVMNQGSAKSDGDRKPVVGSVKMSMYLDEEDSTNEPVSLRKPPELIVTQSISDVAKGNDAAIPK